MALKTVVITGCSTGFGRVTALFVAERGWQVIATVRQAAHRAELLADAAARGQADRLIPLICDITRPADVDHLAQAVAHYGPTLDGLVNNAGTAFPGPLEVQPLADVRAQLEVNLFGQLAVTQALLPALKDGHGTIVNVSSIGGRITFPTHGLYHLSKFALEAMSDALRLELAHFGVKVVIVAPGASPTAIWETSLGRAHAKSADLGAYAPLTAAVERYARQTAVHGFPPERLARAVWGILNERRPAAHYYVPRSAGLIVAARRLLPDWLWDQAARLVLRW